MVDGDADAAATLASTVGLSTGDHKCHFKVNYDTRTHKGDIQLVAAAAVTV